MLQELLVLDVAFHHARLGGVVVHRRRCAPLRSSSSLPGTLLSAAPPLNSLSASAKWVIASLTGAGLRSWTMIFDFVSGPHCGGRLAPFLLALLLALLRLGLLLGHARRAAGARHA